MEDFFKIKYFLPKNFNKNHVFLMLLIKNYMKKQCF